MLAVKLRNFLSDFMKDGRRVYIERIREMTSRGRRSFTVEFDHLIEFDLEAAEEAKENPLAFYAYLKWAALDLVKSEDPEAYEEIGKELEQAVSMLPEEAGEELKASVIPLFPRVKRSDVTHSRIKELLNARANSFVCFRGVVVAFSPVKREALIPVFRCLKCGEKTVGDRIDFFVLAPERCTKNENGVKCGGTLVLSEDTTSVLTATLKVQDAVDFARFDEAPLEIPVILRGELAAEELTQGDAVVVTGVLRVSSFLKSSSAILTVYVEAFDVSRDVKDYRDLEITEEERKRIQEVAAGPDVKQKLISCIAPSIKGREEVKEGILLALFSAPREQNPDGTFVRGDIHVLIVGDPGVGKSQMLLAVSKLVPRGVYVSGPRASGVGLTAAVVKDEMTGRFMVHGGSAVLANGGVLIVDEFDKMSKDDRGALHEVLEQQTVTVAKAGIHAQLPARCTLIAAANPKFGSYQREMSLAENIDLPPTILSRFDLIFLIQDSASEREDEEIARFVLKKEDEKAPPFPPEFVRKYIAVAKSVNPVLSEEAAELLRKFFVEVRKKCGQDAAVKVGVRQLEAAKRLALAHARMRLSRKAEKQDVEAAISLMNFFLEEEGFLTELSQLEVGKTTKQVKEEEAVREILKKMSAQAGAEGVLEADFVITCKEEGYEERIVRKILEAMKRNGEVVEPKIGRIKAVF
jgi:Predicted ATPase involved in replication control, Cdc46/Mcm family